MFSFLRDLYYEGYETAHAWYRGLTHNRKWLLMRQLSRFTKIRCWIKQSVVKQRLALCAEPCETAIDQSVFPDVAIDQVVQSIQQDGYFLGLQLPLSIVRSILDFANQQPCLGNRYPDTGFYYAEKAQAEAHYQTAFVTASYFNTALTCPAIVKLGQDPVLRAIAARYLGAEPVLISSRLWWSFPSRATVRDRRKSAQMFHYDLDDYGFLKFFFYLTDVDEWAGPHICVRGTHLHKRWSHEWFGKKFSEAAIERAYGSANVITVCGESGFGFAEDTFCFHRASPPQKHDRLILQLEYALQDYGMERDTIDPQSVRVYAAGADLLNWITSLRR